MTKSRSLLSKIELISKAATESGQDFAQVEGVDPEIETVADFLNISRKQVIIFACVLELSLNKIVSIDILSKHLKLNNIRILDEYHELEALERKSLIIRCNRQFGSKFTYSDFGFLVPLNVIEALRTCNKELLQTTITFNLPNFLKKINDLVFSREENSFLTSDLLDQIEFLICNNLTLSFVRYVNKKISQSINKAFIFVMAYRMFKRDDNVSVDTITQALFDDISEQMQYEQNLYARRNELVKKDLIRFQDAFFINEKVAILTSPVLKKLYKDYPELYFRNESDNSLIKSRSIKPKPLFFDDRLQEQLDSIVSVLGRKRFPEYQHRLERRNMPKGLTVLFHGKSGTGKTESVLQIAKQTGRDLVMVELSELRSKWFGDSEKQVKQLFDNYRSLAASSSVVPILFINEADGMFTKRTELRGSSSVDQTVNTMQNIILQELERFDGILFATTNLTVNFDMAFERRFLFKVEFDNPLPEVSSKIWKAKLPDLSDDQSEMLAMNYNLSGGEIDNIVRKYIIQNIISDDTVDFDRLLQYCEAGRSFQKRGRMGFCSGN